MVIAVAEGAKGTEVSVITAAAFSPEQVGEYSAIAFGCPSIGSEQLVSVSSSPVFTACEGRRCGKSLALFGSYGWGDGEWMRSWESRRNDDGANLACESVICNEAPDDDARMACRELGASLADKSTAEGGRGSSPDSSLPPSAHAETIRSQRNRL